MRHSYNPARAEELRLSDKSEFEKEISDKNQAPELGLYKKN